jgi:hypothetical protein
MTQCPGGAHSALAASSVYCVVNLLLVPLSCMHVYLESKLQRYRSSPSLLNILLVSSKPVVICAAFLQAYVPGEQAAAAAATWCNARGATPRPGRCVAGIKPLRTPGAAALPKRQSQGGTNRVVKRRQLVSVLALHFAVPEIVLHGSSWCPCCNCNNNTHWWHA